MDVYRAVKDVKSDLPQPYLIPVRDINTCLHLWANHLVLSAKSSNHDVSPIPSTFLLSYSFSIRSIPVLRTNV